MSSTTPVEVLLGCDPQVNVRITEDDGNLIIRLTSLSPDQTDIDALFFDLAGHDDAASTLSIYPFLNTQHVTGFEVDPGNVNQVSNGATLQDSYDTKVEFGTEPNSTTGDFDNVAMTFWIGGSEPLTADSIDLSKLAVVINSDGGNGVVLTSGATPEESMQEVVYAEDFNGLDDADDSDLIESDAGWDVDNGALRTDGNNDGDLRFAAVDTDGPVEFSFSAKGVNLHEFENSGRYEDTMRVEVQIDGGDWVLLDEFRVNDAGDEMVGSETGQTFDSSLTELSYSGGVLDGAEDTAQFRIVSDISAGNEKIYLDDVEIKVTEASDATGTTTKVLAEDFNDVHNAEDSDLVESDDRWDVSNDQLFTNGYRDGELRFAEVDTDGPVEFCFSAKGVNLHEFENSGRYEDTLRVEVQIDGGDWVLLDEFRVNDAGDAMVGSETGQEFDGSMTELSYAGGVLEGAESSAQFRIVSDISACNEKIILDDVEIKVTEGNPVPEDEHCEDFSDAAAGDVAFDQFDGFTVTAQRDGDAADSENDAMIFDSTSPTGGDSDLRYADQGNILIISEDNDSDDPDDEAHGGSMHFEFDELADMESISVLDIEEQGGTIDLWDADGNSLGSVDIPTTGNNGQATVDINVDGVSSMDVNLVGSGAVDDVCFTFEADKDCLQYDATYEGQTAQELLNEPAPEEEQPDDMLVY